MRRAFSWLPVTALRIKMMIPNRQTYTSYRK